MPSCFAFRGKKSDCWNKLCLLMRKNISIQLANPFSTAIILIAPILLFIYSQRAQITNRNEPERIPATKFEELQLSNGTVPKDAFIYYSPHNEVLAEIIRTLASHLNTDNVKAFTYASEMDTALVADNAFVGIEFEDHLMDILTLPPKLTVALRFPQHLRTRAYDKWPTKLFKRLIFEGGDIYEAEGFLQIQARLSEAIIMTNHNVLMDCPHVYMKPFPDKARWVYTYLLESYSSFISVFPFLFLFTSLVMGRKIVAEKQGEIREIMNMMGLSTAFYWLPWFLIMYLLFLIPVLVLILLIKLYMCPASSIILLFIIFFVHIISMITFTFLICAFVSNTITAIIALTLMSMLSYVPYLLRDFNEVFGRNLNSCVWMNTAMPLIFIQVLGYEIRGTGAQLSNMFQPSHPDDKTNIGHILLVMMGINLLRMFCFLYVDQLNPGQYTIRKKWYFLCQRKFWCPWDRHAMRIISYEGDEEQATGSVFQPSNMDIFEPLDNRRVIVELRDVSKDFGEKTAVQNFSLKLYEDEITVLLGSNGSGKSTILLMIAGMLAPTSGNVIINGTDVSKYPQKARQSLCMCPKPYELFEELTALWNIVFFGRLKGLTAKAAEREATHYLEKLNIVEKANVRLKHLSGNIRRKISLCCALCGNSKVVLLDEPIANLDNISREDMWNLLRIEKYGRCIILNTHAMDTAEILSDRIAVLVDGQLYGYGSSAHLINQHGPGYRLICIRNSDCNVDEVTKYLIRHMISIRLESVVDSEITYRLPVNYLFRFHKLFFKLERKMRSLNITDFWVSAPTLGETFIKINADKIDRSYVYDNSYTEYGRVSSLNNNEERRPIKKCLNVWQGLLTKKILYAKRYLYLFGFVIILPVVASLMLLLLNYLYEKGHTSQFYPYDLRAYPGATVVMKLMEGDAAGLAKKFERLTIESGASLKVSNQPLNHYLLENLNTDKEGFSKTIVSGATIGKEAVTAWFNKRLEHSAMVSMGLVFKAIGREFVEIDLDIINKPRRDSSHIVTHVSYALSRATFVLLYLSMGTAAFILLPIQERVSQMKQQQLISGISLWTYWLSHMIWDTLLIMLMAISIVISLKIHGGDDLHWLFFLEVFFGLSALPLTYLLSLLFKEPGIGMSYVLILYLLIAFVARNMEEVYLKNYYMELHAVLLVLPHYAMYFGLLDVLKRGQTVGTCRNLEIGSVCSITNELCYRKSTEFWKVFVYLLISGLFCFALLIVIGNLPAIIDLIKNCPRICFVSSEDNDVGTMRFEVKSIVNDSNKLKMYNLLCNDVSKKRGRFLSVNCLSFKISSYECFGLLGPNGAGKTCTIDMIVGNTAISQGDIFVRGHSLKRHRKRTKGHMGYCPEQNTVLDYMTGRQMLKFACLTIGIQKKYVNEVINSVAEGFVLSSHLDLFTRHYTAGTKRKLNIAMAVLARSLVCLDEPTAGIDFGAKQDIWLILKRMREQGISLMLTTKNVEECKALCSCLAIMVNGHLKCIGTINHLNTRFNEGITIRIEVATMDELAGSESFTSIGQDSSVTSLVENSSRGSVLLPLEDSGISTTKSTPALSSEEIKKTPRVTVERSHIASPNPILSPRSINGNKSTTFSGKLETIRESEIGQPDNYETLISNVERKFQEDFPGSTVKDLFIHRGLVSIGIPNQQIRWSEIFKYMEENRYELQIKHYSVSQTTLTDILNKFAKDQVRH